MRIHHLVYGVVSALLLWFSGSLVHAQAIPQLDDSGIPPSQPLGEVVVLLDSSATMNSMVSKTSYQDLARWCVSDLIHACPDNIPVHLQSFADGRVKSHCFDSLCPISRSQIIRSVAACRPSGQIDFGHAIKQNEIKLKSGPDHSKLFVLVSGGEGYETDNAAAYLRSMQQRCNAPCKLIVVGTCNSNASIVSLQQLASLCNGSFVSYRAQSEYAALIKLVLESRQGTNQSDLTRLLVNIEEARREIRELSETNRRRFDAIIELIKIKTPASAEDLQSIRIAIQSIRNEISGTLNDQKSITMLNSIVNSISNLERRFAIMENQLNTSATMLSSIKNGSDFNDSASLVGISSAITNLEKQVSSNSTSQPIQYWIPWLAFGATGFILGALLSRWFFNSQSSRPAFDKLHNQLVGLSKSVADVEQSVLATVTETQSAIRVELGNLKSECNSTRQTTGQTIEDLKKSVSQCCSEIKLLLANLECNVQRGNDRTNDLIQRFELLSQLINTKHNCGNQPESGNRDDSLLLEIRKLKLELEAHRDELKAYVRHMIAEHCPETPETVGELSIENIDSIKFGPNQNSDIQDDQISRATTELTKLVGLSNQNAIELFHEGITNLNAMMNLSDAEIDDIVSRMDSITRAQLIDWRKLAKFA